MDSTYKLKTRNVVSTWFSLFFFILLLAYLGFIEFFQDSQSDNMALDLLTNPIQKSQLEKITKVEFTNRLGEFVMIKENSSWLLQKPRTIPAKEETINKIFTELKNLTIQTIHEYEPINFRSFSLDNPVVEMNLSSKDESINIKIGLINPIDNTSYLVVSGRDQIYQTSLFNYQLERLELSDFVDSGVFSMELDNIKRFSLYQGKETIPSHVLENLEGSWISNKYNSIQNRNVETKLTTVLDVKTHMIVDKVDEELQTFINNYTSSPLYRISIETKDGKTVSYKVTSLIKSIQELRVEGKQYFIMSASDRPYPFLISKQYLDRFFIKYADIK